MKKFKSFREQYDWLMKNEPEFKQRIKEFSDSLQATSSTPSLIIPDSIKSPIDKWSKNNQKNV